MVKQDKSKFQLNKGASHSFDISKGQKRKFDLAKDVDEPVVPSAPAKEPVASPAPIQEKENHKTPSLSNPEASEKKNGKWLWIILTLIVIALLIWWLLSGKTSEPQPLEEDTAEQVATPTEDETADVTEETALPTEGVDVPEAGNTDETVTPAAPANTPAADTEVSKSTASQNATTAADNTSTNASDDIEAEAMKVIRGDYGAGQERKNRLGSKYQTIQARVNELKRKGIF